MGTELTRKLEELRGGVTMLSGPNGLVTKCVDQCIVLSKQPPAYAISNFVILGPEITKSGMYHVTLPDAAVPWHLCDTKAEAIYWMARANSARFVPSPRAVTAEGIMEVVDQWLIQDDWLSEPDDDDVQRIVTEKLRTRLDQYLNQR